MPRSSRSSRHSNGKNTPKSTRLTIPESVKEQVCNYVLTASSPVSGKAIFAWAKHQLGYSFPQSTISTLLSSRGITIKRSGRRGRPPIANKLPSYTGADGFFPGDRILTAGQQRHSKSLYSTNTGLMLCQLQRLADGRLRSSSGDHPDIELAALEETYNLLRVGCSRVTPEWLFGTVKRLFQNKQQQQLQMLQQGQQSQKPHKPVLTTTKYISQFLNLLYKKYYLTNVIADCIVAHSLSYHDMMAKLSLKFPALRMAPIPFPATSSVLTSTSSSSSIPALDSALVSTDDADGRTPSPQQFHTPVYALDRNCFYDASVKQQQQLQLQQLQQQQLQKDWFPESSEPQLVEYWNTSYNCLVQPEDIKVLMPPTPPYGKSNCSPLPCLIQPQINPDLEVNLSTFQDYFFCANTK